MKKYIIKILICLQFFHPVKVRNELCYNEIYSSDKVYRDFEMILLKL
jgi:hypothetical protein